MRIEYQMADDDQKTADLEEEDLTRAVDDVDDDEPEVDTRTNGQLVYEVLKKRKLVDDGDWDGLVFTLKKGWEQYAKDTMMGDLRDEMIEELS